MRKIVMTCEHGGNHIPEQYAQYFHGFEDILNSHQGFDIGALEMAKKLADRFAHFFYYSETSRLLVELNRSTLHSKLFSEISKKFPRSVKESVLTEYYFPYRQQVERTVGQFVGSGYRVIHISIHTFTPSTNGQIRNNDIGLLYDSARREEKKLCQDWKQYLTDIDANLVVRFNYPYLGKTDGFVSYLRQYYPENRYIGIELEVNQNFFIEKNNRRIEEILKESLLKLRRKNFSSL